jgi:hypothetical protein
MQGENREILSPFIVLAILAWRVAGKYNLWFSESPSNLYAVKPEVVDLMEASTTN